MKKLANGARVLLVENDAILGRSLRRYLDARGYEVTVARTAAEGMQRCHGWSPDVALVEQLLPDMDGEQLVERVFGQLGSRGPRFVMVADLVTRSYTPPPGTLGVLEKPFLMDELIRTIDGVLRA